MEAAIRWSPSSTTDDSRFLIADVARNLLRGCRVTSGRAKEVSYETIWRRDRLPNFNAFDWSPFDESVVAVGTEVGEARVMRLNSPSENVQSFPLRLQRKCNSVAFNSKNHLAVGLDRTRNDPSSLRVYDVQQSRSNGGASDQGRRIGVSDTVTHVKFFGDEPEVLLCGVLRKCLSLYDLRDPSTMSAASIVTRNVHLLSIDPLDDNYFASAGPPGTNVVNIWDRRAVATVNATNMQGSFQSTPVLEVSPAFSEGGSASLWSLRYSSHRRGCFATLSSSGQLRLFEMSSFAAANDLGPDEQPETTHYIKRSTDVVEPVPEGTDAATSRLLAFDFAHPGTISSTESVLCLNQNRSLRVVNLLPTTRGIDIPGLSGMRFSQGRLETMTSQMSLRDSLAQASVQDAAPARFGKIDNQHAAKAESKLEANNHAHSEAIPMPRETTYPESAPKVRPQIPTDLYMRSQAYGESANMSSRDRHARFADLANSNPEGTSSSQRRCREGYLFDCKLNKKIVSDDPWLIELWDIVGRMEEMATDQGMVDGSLDLAYLGVHDIWFEKLLNPQARLLRQDVRNMPDISSALVGIASRKFSGAFAGAKTAKPAHRQLCLAISGWLFDKAELQAKCDEIINRGEYYKAILVAFCHGNRQMALDLLRNLVRERKMENSGLAAVIAFDTASEEQRDQCKWMADEADDPYHKALLSYFVTGDWSSVVEMSSLPLLYRVAVALKYLDDDHLSTFIKDQTADTVDYGDTEGVVLTGLTERAMTLFQHYIARFNDVQTAVLATGFTVPQYVSDPRWEVWRDSYFQTMQSWRAFIERSRFTVLHNRKAGKRRGERLKPPAAQIALRCMHCQKSIAKRDPEANDDVVSIAASTITRVKSAHHASAISCPRCGANLVRCCICMEWLGSPDPSNPSIAEMLSERDLLGSALNFCIACNHASHPDHARDWFASNSECPVPHCNCQCNAPV